MRRIIRKAKRASGSRDSVKTGTAQAATRAAAKPGGFSSHAALSKAYFPEDGTIYYTPDEGLMGRKEYAPLVAKNCIERGDMLSG